MAEGLGQRYQFRDRGGIEMEFLLNSAADIDRLEEAAVTERLQYVAKALPLIKSALGGRTALIGFAGSPWTLANFMIEGGGVKEYTKAKALFYSDPPLFARLLEKLTQAVTRFLQLQIDAGADAVQIFDSLGGVLSDGDFERASARWMKQIVGELKGRVPVIVFSKGTHGNWDDLVDTGAQVLGVDWNVRLADVGGEAARPRGRAGQSRPVPAVHDAGSRGRRDGPHPARDARSARAISSTWATACRQMPNWRTLSAWLRGARLRCAKV